MPILLLDSSLSQSNESMTATRLIEKIFPHVLVFSLLPLAVFSYMIAGYYVLLAPGKLYNALVSEDWQLFRSEIFKYIAVTTSAVIVKVVRGVLRESSSNLFRHRLANALHVRYFGPFGDRVGYGASPYYKLASEQTVDNPDQRIVADSRSFSSSLFDIIAGGPSEGRDSGGLLEASASLLWYSYTTWMRTGWYGVVVAYLWSTLVASISVFAINRTSPAVFRQEKLEADFRYAHTELRRRAEQVAFLRGASFEHHNLSVALGRAVSNQWIVISRHIALNVVQYGFGYYISLLMYLTLAIAIRSNIFESTSSFTSDMTPGEKAQWISQTGSIFLQLLYSFTMIVQLSTSISAFVASSDRLATLVTALDTDTGAPVNNSNSDMEPLLPSRDLSQNASYGDVSEGIIVDDVCIFPTGDVKIGPVSFSVAKGQWVLLDGRSGSGKSSVIRVLRGLWRPASGHVQLPADEKAVMFVPQVPYIPAVTCSLRDLVIYPQTCNQSLEETEKVTVALSAVGWKRGAVDVLDVEKNWSGCLSPGEAQLIAAARVLVQKPAYAVLDEPTSALDAENERSIFIALREASISGLTVGHRESLHEMHDTVISLKHPRDE